MAKLNPEEQRKRNWRRTVIDDIDELGINQDDSPKKRKLMD